MLRIHSHAKKLVDAGIFVPGHMQEQRNFWLFPLVVENRDLFIKYMLNKGVLAVKTSTQLKEVKPDSENYQHAPMTRWLMDNVIYVPVQKDIPESDLAEIIKRLCEGAITLRKHAEAVGAQFRNSELDKKFAITPKL